MKGKYVVAVVVREEIQAETTAEAQQKLESIVRNAGFDNVGHAYAVYRWEPPKDKG